MIKILKADPSYYEILVNIWENSVKATHDFLPLSEIERLKPLVKNQYMPNVTIFMAVDAQNMPIGFIGTNQNRIEMLFIAPNERANGVGKALLIYVINELNINEVDVNEQNSQAVGFYLHMGFAVSSRSELDSDGKPYPILTMKYQPVVY